MSDISNEEVIRRFNEMCVNHAVKRHEEKSKHEDSNKTIKPCAEAITTEQLEAQSRVAIKAWCDDPSVQLEFSGKIEESWLPKNQQIGAFDIRYYHYRIAKPRKWYRVAKLKEGTATADNENQEKFTEGSRCFIEWLDERRYYD